LTVLPAQPGSNGELTVCADRVAIAAVVEGGAQPLRFPLPSPMVSLIAAVNALSQLLLGHEPGHGMATAFAPTSALFAWGTLHRNTSIQRRR
jgi:hypothetical protein